MKYRLVEMLCNPENNADFDVEVFDTETQKKNISFDEVRCQTWCHWKQCEPRKIESSQCASCYNNEIISGKLICKNSQKAFPIINGIPRILPEDILIETLTKYHPEFIERYGQHFQSISGMDIPVDEQKKATLHSFSYQWTTFVDNFSYYKEIFLSFVHPYLAESDFPGKTVLEIGCGSGRPATTACQLGAEVVAMDLGEAVETAYQSSLKQPLLHIVQADAYAPPFKPCFDIVYSVGVLQHITDPNKALKGMYQTVSEQAQLILWVYGKREFWYQPIEWLRTLTTKMPYSVVRLMSMVFAVCSELFLLIPYRIMSKIPALNKLAEKIPGRIYAKFPFKENVVGWFDRLSAPVTYYFSQEDIEGMLKGAGFSGIEVYARKDASASWVVKAIKKIDE